MSSALLSSATLICALALQYHTPMSRPRHATVTAALAGESAMSVAGLKRSRSAEERLRWQQQDRWMPRQANSVKYPIDDDTLYDALRLLNNRSTLGRPLSKREVGKPTIRWLAKAADATAAEYIDYVEGVLAAREFMRKRRPEAAMKEDEMLPNVAKHFAPLAMARRVDAALSAAPPPESVEHAEVARSHLPTVWSLFRHSVRTRLVSQCVATTGAARGWAAGTEWVLLGELQELGADALGHGGRQARALTHGVVRRRARATASQRASPSPSGATDAVVMRSDRTRGGAREREAALDR